MRQFLARLLGLDRELRLKDAAIRRQREQIEALKKGKKDVQGQANHRARRAAELVELLEAQQEQATHAAALIRDARKVVHLRNSGPAKAREHMTKAIDLLEGEHP